MPVQISNKDFTDFLGASTSFLQANAGDLFNYKCRITESIGVTSTYQDLIEQNLFIETLEAFSDIWTPEGFLVGDTVTVEVFQYNSTTAVASGTADILAINGGQLQLDANPIATYYSPFDYFFRVTANRNRESLDILPALTNVNSEISLIDGTLVRMRFNGLGAMSVSDVKVGQYAGKKSGMYEVTASLELISDTSNVREYELILSTYQIGAYVPFAFTGGNLKLYIRQEWKNSDNEPNFNTVVIDTQNADTGAFNVGYSTQTPNSTLVTGAPQLFWNTVQTFTVVVSGTTTGLQIGACFLPEDDDYFKDKFVDQSSLGMLLNAYNEITTLTLGVYNSAVNPSGAGYSIETLSVSGGTVGLRFTPNANFGTFMSSRNDRRFVLWLKAGNTNHILFDGQLQKAPKDIQPFAFRFRDILDHSENVDSVDAPKKDNPPSDHNKEDDLAFFGRATLQKGVQWDNVRFAVVALNTVTGDFFELEKFDFNVSPVPFSITQVKLFNESTSVGNNLPTTSAKKQAYVKWNGVQATSTYEVDLYYPFILRWEYWLQQLNANIAFYPNQNKDWFNYQGGDWGVFVVVEMENESQILRNGFPINIIDYDDWNYSSQITLRVASSNTQVNTVLANTLMKVEAFHNCSPEIWESDVWGMITVEPFEGAPRWIISTVYDGDGNADNPLLPVDGETRCKISFPSPNVVKLECLFDPEVIGNQKVKFTSKIKSETTPVNYLITTDDELIETDNGDFLIYEE